MSRLSSVRLVVAGLLIVAALVLASSALNFNGRRFKRAIGRNATPWNVTNDYIPPWIMLLSREPPPQPTNLGYIGVPDDFPTIIKDSQYDLIRYAYDGNFAGLGIIYGKLGDEQFMIANVETMYRASDILEDGWTFLRGWDLIKESPIMTPISTTWHPKYESLHVRHIMTFGRSGFGLYAIEYSPDRRSASRALIEGTNIGISLSHDKHKRNADYKFCWAYSMMHGYYDEEGPGIYHNFTVNTVKRFWGRWPVQLVGCDKGSICQFVFDRYFWVNEPDNTKLQDMPESMKAQAFPCGWQDVGAPIFCARDQEDEYAYDAIRWMELRYLIVKGDQPDPNQKNFKGKFAKDCYDSRSHLGNFTAFSLDKAITVMMKYRSTLAKPNGTRPLV